MAFDRFVQVGRVIQITYGPDAGKLAVIVDILDHNRALIDGPCSGVSRQILAFRRLKLTKIVIPKLPRSCGQKTVKKYWLSSGVDAAWAKTAASKKAAALVVRKGLSDFDRFKVMVLKQRRARAVAAKN